MAEPAIYAYFAQRKSLLFIYPFVLQLYIPFAVKIMISDNSYWRVSFVKQDFAINHNYAFCQINYCLACIKE